MKIDLDKIVEEAWNGALGSWNNPNIPRAITPKTSDDVNALGEIGVLLGKELAFMDLKDFQTYVNLQGVGEAFKEDVDRGIKIVTKHEVGHRFCPYDVVTSIILKNGIKKVLEGKELPYGSETAAGVILNLFTDMSINTRIARSGDENIAWGYEQLSKDKTTSKVWGVYARSMELAWGKKILPEKTELSKEQAEAAEELARIFEGNLLDRTRWKDNSRRYAEIVHRFLEEERKDGNRMDNAAGNIPKVLDEKTSRALAKRLSEIGDNGLPTNPAGLREYKEILAGFGQGDPVKASVQFYDKLSDSYNVSFATQPFGRPRVNPFSPERWVPSMGAEKLDVSYSAQRDGRVLPGVNTYSWKTRKREVHGGLEEVTPDLDIFMDSSATMTNPLEEISLAVLSEFVIAKKAHRKGASIRSTVFSGSGQYATVGPTRNLQEIFENAVVYYNGGTIFPINQMLSGRDPRHVIVITDSFLCNESETASVITEFKKRNKQNGITIYAVHPVPSTDVYIEAGAEIISGTTTDIFRKVIGKPDEVYKNE